MRNIIKVVHCISDTNFGGAGRVLLNYLAHFDTSAFDVTVVLPKGSKLLGYMDPEKYEIVEFDGLYDRSYDRKDVRGLVDLFRCLCPVIVHSHGALSARIAGKKIGAKVVYTRHSVFDLPEWQTSFFGRKMLGTLNHRYSDRIIAVSPAAKTLLTETGTDPSRIDVVMNGVERVLPVTESEKDALRERYGVQKGDFVCSIIARLEEVKGHRYLIDACAALKKQGVRDLKVLIAGTGGIRDDLIRYAGEKDVTDIVHFVGFIKNISDLLSVTDLQINASYGTEATSMALLEGFSMGIPAIASDFGGNPFVVEDGVNGLLFAKKDPAALARAILQMKEDRVLYEQCSSGAFADYESRFTAENMTRETEKVYFKILKKEEPR